MTFSFLQYSRQLQETDLHHIDVYFSYPLRIIKRWNNRDLTWKKSDASFRSISAEQFSIFANLYRIKRKIGCSTNSFQFLQILNSIRYVHEISFLFIALRNVKSIYFYSLLHVYGAFHTPIESKTRPSSLPGNWTWPETGNRLSDASCIFYEIPTSYRANKRRAHDCVRENS